jgi:tellurite resistance protein TehA-like permease
MYNIGIIFVARICFCTIVAISVAVIWLPTSKDYRYHGNALIQKNDGMIGFKEFYYTRINLPPFIQKSFPFNCYLPPYATRVVALTGTKQVGYTQFDTKLRICWDGFFIMVIFTSIIIYVFFRFYVFFEKKFIQCSPKILNDFTPK